LKFLEAYSKNALNFEIPDIKYSFIVRHVNDNPFTFITADINENIDSLKSSVLSSIDQTNIKYISGFTDIYNVVEEQFLL